MLQSSMKMTFSIIDFAVRHNHTRLALRNKSKLNCLQGHLAEQRPDLNYEVLGLMRNM